jgi:hypothetical protein
MVSNQKSKCESDKTRPKKTDVYSHCPWQNLTAEELTRKIDNCRMDRQKMRKKIDCLEEKFKEVNKI